MHIFISTHHKYKSTHEKHTHTQTHIHFLPSLDGERNVLELEALSVKGISQATEPQQSLRAGCGGVCLLLGSGGGHEQEPISGAASMTTTAAGAGGGGGGGFFCVCVCLCREDRKPSEGLDLDGCEEEEEEAAQEKQHAMP